MLLARHAGVLLAKHVTVHLGIVAMSRRPLVIAVPHGGLPVAARVAALIGADLRAVVVRRVTAIDPQRACLATVTAEGSPVFDHDSIRRLHTSADALTVPVGRQRTEAAELTARYHHELPNTEITGRVVVVVDDGLVTGLSACAVLHRLRAARPARLVMATPVTSPEARRRLVSCTDALICPHTTTTALEQCYADFHRLPDGDVE
ncbi:phosphoribosyltransferase family protein [Actinoplanes sp. Pm04-4]|uniref:Phosphoribosyltransferase family protein n=1 Tax=Paractinoplanes pyxinae TaxID=2997416 RepID=A0ABT4BB42_9ACTN|nr:phosphoribosyltransferase family protein [Actinoplanes pyxinae]MCY1143735.1 phosphoribosyltransferase family protein [Actinoplanes pyxinae]